MTASAASVRAVATCGYGFRDGRLTCRGIDLDRLAARVGTPCYVYDGPGIAARYASLSSGLAPLRASIRYAVKANPAPAVLRLLGSLGAGMDVVSAGELERAWLAGVPMSRVCMAGVAKSDDELRAALDGRYSPLRAVAEADPTDRGPIGLINVESESELHALEAVARDIGVRARVAVRVNPGVTAGSHQHVRVGGVGSKFGLPPVDALRVARLAHASDMIEFCGLHMHIGSQIADLGCFDAALTVIVELAATLRGEAIAVETIDVGAGFAVSYMGEPAPSDEAFAATLARRLAPEVNRGVEVLVEPGRELVAQAGVLLTGVRHVKRAGDRTVIVTDAGLNALVRPAMYGARHMIWPVVCDPALVPDPIAPPAVSGPGLRVVDVVGPVCESSDEFLTSWAMPGVRRGDTLAVMTAGAYGMPMAMTFNDLAKPAEVMVTAEGEASLVTPRVELPDLLDARPGGAWSRGPVRIDL